MNKFDYGNFDSTNADIAFASTSGYTDPASELETRKQLSYPLKELKTYINNTVTEDSLGNAIQLVATSSSLKYRTTAGGALTDITLGIPTGGTTGQVLKKNSSSNYDVSWGDAGAYSFVGMVVSSTNLDTEAKVKNIYGASTSWTLLSSVILASNHVYGNGKSLGLTDGSNNFSLTFNGYDLWKGTPIGQNTGSSVTESSSGTSKTGIGVPTKSQVSSDPNNSGLIVDTKTVYTWERTA